jgi:hypothetical protein
MNRNGLIVLQVFGALSILPYPFVLLANIMSMAAPGHTPASTAFWGLLCLYPLLWIALYFFSWRAMGHGSVGLAFGLSSIPALACLIVVGVYLYSWVGVGLGMAAIGNGGIHTEILTKSNVLMDSITLASEDIQVPTGGATALQKALQNIEANPTLVNVRVPGHGTPLNAALNSFIVTIEGTITGDPQRRQDRIQLIRALVEHGAQLSKEESTDLHKTWLLRRALLDRPVTTATENPLVWRIVRHDRGDSKPWNPLTEPLPPRNDTPVPFIIRTSETELVNRTTRLHGTPLYAALLDNAPDVCAVLIKAGGRLSPEEEHDPGAASALRALFEHTPDLQTDYDRRR